MSSSGSTTSSASVYQDYKDDLQQRIFSIHGISFPEVGGVPNTGGGLSREQIMEKFTVFQNTTVRDFQMPILAGFNKLIQYIAPGELFTINKIDLFDGLDAPAEDVVDPEEDTGALTNLTPENDGE